MSGDWAVAGAAITIKTQASLTLDSLEFARCTVRLPQLEPLPLPPIIAKWLLASKTIGSVRLFTPDKDFLVHLLTASEFTSSSFRGTNS